MEKNCRKESTKAREGGRETKVCVEFKG